MKNKFWKFVIFLICFYSLDIFKITKFFKINTFEEYNIRFLLDDTTINYDISNRENKEDIESIKNCENSDYKYFLNYITGYNITFDKTIDQSRAVRNKYII